ncbi:MAG: hypothetical protein ACXVHK_30625 [Solirubrobacteraceae bacterium]
MPFKPHEVIAMSDGLLLIAKEEWDRMERAANAAQRHMWAKHSDELVGVPEVDPDCFLLADLLLNAAVALVEGLELVNGPPAATRRLGCGPRNTQSNPRGRWKPGINT